MGRVAVDKHRATIDAMIGVVLEVLHRPGPFDFGDRGFVSVLREHGVTVAADREAWHVPPADTIFVQRKISGTALLCARLKARVPLRGMAGPFVGFASDTGGESL
jgi:hypothetical protein